MYTKSIGGKYYKVLRDIMHKDLEKILFTQEQIDARVKELAAQINKDYKGEEIVLVGILKGSVFFYTDLARNITESTFLEFMSVSSYNGTRSSGEVINKDISMPVEGKHLLVVEDIIDTGFTLSYLKKVLLQRNPKSVKICSLLDKPARRKVDFEGDYIGFTIPDAFVVGYGLDYNQRYRNLPEIGILKKEVYEN